jgi:hypothetical protein
MSLGKQMGYIVRNAVGTAMMAAVPVAFLIVPSRPLYLLPAGIVLATVGFILFRRSYQYGCPLSPDFFQN